MGGALDGHAKLSNIENRFNRWSRFGQTHCGVRSLVTFFFHLFFFFNGDPYLSPQQPKGLTSENNECIKKRALSLSSFLSPSRWPCLQVASKCFWERLLRLRIRWLWVIGSCYETLVTTPLPLLGSHDNNNNDDDDYNEDDDLQVIQSN